MDKEAAGNKNKVRNHPLEMFGPSFIMGHILSKLVNKSLAI
jgi:hypothetical protein